MHHVTRSLEPNRLRRYGRWLARTLLAACVFAGTLATATPSQVGVATPTGSTASASTASVSSASVSTVAVPTMAVTAAVRTTSAQMSSNRSVVRPGAAVTLTGKVTYGAKLVRNQTVSLQMRSGDNVWSKIASKRLSSAGAAAFTIKPRKSRTYRVAYSGNGSFAASRSPSKRITVKPFSAADRARVLRIAAAQSGKPYAYGAAGPRAFDCSGFTQYVFKQVGVWMPHKANAQRSRGRAVSRSGARPGDLIIFLSGGYGYHVGIYAGGNYMYDSPRPGLRVGKHKIWSGNVVFRRIL